MQDALDWLRNKDPGGLDDPNLLSMVKLPWEAQSS